MVGQGRIDGRFLGRNALTAQQLGGQHSSRPGGGWGNRVRRPGGSLLRFRGRWILLRVQILNLFAAISSQLFSFHAHVDKLSKVLIKRGDRHVLGHGGRSDQTVDKVALRSLIAVHSV